MTDFDATNRALSQSLAEAEAALGSFAQGPAQEAADAVAAAFERSGARIARALVGAGLDGENAMRRLAKTVLEEVARAGLASAGLSGGAAARSQDFGLARPIAITMNFAAGADATGIARHQGQIAAQLARAVAYGSRNL